MSNSLNKSMHLASTAVARREGWWSDLDLTLTINRLAHDPADPATAQGFLRSCAPVAFAHTNEHGDVEHLTLDEVAERLATIEREQAAVALQRREERAAARLRLGAQKLDEAYAAADAEVVVADGAWAGFTRADATAWCWNLFQFEPHGFVHPGSQVRAEALRLLAGGGLPKVFGYPARARALTDSGLTPRSYREHKIALGAATYDRDFGLSC